MINTSTIPTEPGCYLYKNDKGIIIYVGKAKNLKKRVSSYFTKNTHDAKTRLLIQNIASVDFVVTDSEVEALLLENTLIKKHQPKYNISLKDSRRYAYLKMTDEEFPRLISVRTTSSKGTYFGPFVVGMGRWRIQEALVKIFQIRTCKKLPKRACLRYHIGLCSGPCIDAVSKDEYDLQVEHALTVLNGKTSELITDLKKEMKEHSAKQNYEHAMKLRDQIQSLEMLNERQNVQRKKQHNEDIIHYLVRNGKTYLILFNINKGILENKQEFRFDFRDDFFEEFLVQYYADNPVPKEVILPHEVDPIIQEYLESLRKNKVIITVPKIGEKKHLLDLVMKNIELSFFGDQQKVEALQKDLKLNFVPEVIECFDISHLSGTATVASMVQFRMGKPDKSNYRRFKIRTVEGIDDFASMAEVVRRRYSRLKLERGDLPDLIVIDGGKGQLHAALDVLKEMEIKVPTISLAKKFEEVYVPGLRVPLRLDMKGKALKYLREIRDEAHRFAISYNRLLRKKAIKEDSKFS